MSLWQRLRGDADVDERRWVVLDVEASGLDAVHDRLLSIAGVAVDVAGARPCILLDDSFEVLLRQDEPVPGQPGMPRHGDGVDAQRAGVEPGDALRRFVHWLGRSPLLAFHAAFGETLIRRAMSERLGERLAPPWVDLADIVRVLHPQAGHESLDEWLQHFGIVCLQRHQAAADSLATAELLLRLWPGIRAESAGGDFAALRRLAARRRWVAV